MICPADSAHARAARGLPGEEMGVWGSGGALPGAPLPTSEQPEGSVGKRHGSRGPAWRPQPTWAQPGWALSRRRGCGWPRGSAGMRGRGGGAPQRNGQARQPVGARHHPIQPITAWGGPASLWAGRGQGASRGRRPEEGRGVLGGTAGRGPVLAAG